MPEILQKDGHQTKDSATVLIIQSPFLTVNYSLRSTRLQLPNLIQPGKLFFLQASENRENCRKAVAVTRARHIAPHPKARSQSLEA